MQDSKPFSLVERGNISTNLKGTDQILDEIGFGWYHIQLLVILGITISYEAIEVTLLTLFPETAGWDLFLSEKFFLTTSVLVGQLGGLAVLGSFADKYGRRRCIICGWTLIVVFGMLSALSPNSWILGIFRCFVGMGLSSQVILFDLVSEILPSESRGRMLVLAQIFSILGELFVGCLVYIFVESHNWRWMVFLISTPALFVSIAAYWHLPESPRWLVSQHRIPEAEAVLANICISNTSVIPSYVLKESYISGCKEGDFRELISKKFVPISTKVWPIWALHTFVYFLLVLCIRSSFHTDSTGAIQFEFLFLINSAGLIGIAVATQLIDSIGRRMTQCALAMICGIFAVSFSMCHRTTVAVLMAMGVKAGITGLVAVGWVTVTEYYPTEVRCTAHSFANIMGRVGAVSTAVYTSYVSSGYLAVGTGIALACSAIAYFSFMLPETKGVGLDRAFDYELSAGEEDERLLLSMGSDN